MRLGLWLKLTAAFVLAALVPVVLTAWIAREVVSRRYAREYTRSLQGAAAEARRTLTRVGQEIARKVSALARDTDPTVGRLLLELARGRIPPDLQRQLDAEGPRRMRHLGFEVLLIADGRGRVLSAGHAPGRVGMRDPLPRRLVDVAEGKPVYVRLPVEVRGAVQIGVEERPALVVARRVQSHGATVIVVGGLLLETALWDRLPRRNGVAYLLREASGRVIRAPPEGWQPWARLPSRRIAIPGPSPAGASAHAPVGAGATALPGASGAELVVAASDRATRQAQQRLDMIIMALAGSAFLFVVLLVGAVVVRRISGRLSAVAQAAAAVAAGDLEVQLPPGPRDEVGDLVTAFNQMTRELGEARERILQAERVAAWQEIARRIAHEIKNPLTPIQLSIETLRRARRAGRANFDEILEESTQTVLEEVQRLRRIVTEFSEFARMPKPTLGPCDLNEVIRQAAGLYEGGDLAVVLDLRDPLPEIQADREQLMQVLHNLLANARDATAGTDGAEVRITSFATTSHVGFEVADNGPGFDETVRSRLFTPYFTTKAESGTGLGLAIVHRIVTEHGGLIQVAGAPGRGAQFTVLLPRPEDTTP